MLPETGIEVLQTRAAKVLCAKTQMLCSEAEMLQTRALLQAGSAKVLHSRFGSGRRVGAERGSEATV